MLSKEDLRLISDLLDEKFDVNNAKLRKEMAQGNAKLRDELRSEMGQLASDLRTEMAQSNAKLRDELHTEIVQANSELREGIALSIAKLRGDMVKGDTMLREQMELSHAQIESRLAHMETDIALLKTDMHNINLTIEKQISPQIDLLVETFLPEARRFSKAAEEIHAINKDINLLNLTVAKHSRILDEIAAT